ncbi:hypothetical protein Bsub01_03995 [Bacillus subtilis]|uniref:Uncharacterized protein n=1 Tax=Bacillus subtilis subsp. natto TaxID=86029 RepID=E9RJ93_BACNA|nr:hypothetical protein S100333_04435 [Bacillus subtilis subsp. subtilis]ASB72383.1 hypothetical protein S100333_04524 [Bacillus subtilis subsp. subtilis]BAJ77008.1 hypothetical protein [Bacillus subtilis subsp. natto]BEH08387.1 hypothetical protein BSNN_44200 [Bacillus subtilis subsp. natto]
MKCKHCGKTVRMSKEKYNKNQKLCSSCFKLWKKIGRTWGKVG